MKNSNTQKYIVKLCEYIDRFIDLWENPREYSAEMYITAKRADFISNVLGMEYRIATNSWNRIEYLKKSEKESNQKKIEHNIKPSMTRLDFLKSIKKAALAIKKPIKDIEIGGILKNEVNQGNVKEFIECLEFFESILNRGLLRSDVQFHGERANQLSISLGFVSKYRPQMIRYGLIDDDKVMPYKHTEWGIQDFNVSFSQPWRVTDELKAKIEKWLKKANSLLDKTPAKITNDNMCMSPDCRTISARVTFNLTEDQAACIKILWQAYQNGSQELSGDYILTEADIVDKSFNKKMKDVFKKSPAWNTLIVQGSKRGFYKLGIS